MVLRAFILLAVLGGLGWGAWMVNGSFGQGSEASPPEQIADSGQGQPSGTNNQQASDKRIENKQEQTGDGNKGIVQGKADEAKDPVAAEKPQAEPKKAKESRRKSGEGERERERRKGKKKGNAREPAEDGAGPNPGVDRQPEREGRPSRERPRRPEREDDD